MSGQTTGYAHINGAPWLRALVSTPAGALGAHWVLQGVLNMDRTERVFKIGTNLLADMVCFVLLRAVLPFGWALVAGVVGGHTLGWLFNGQVWAALKHFGYVRHGQAEFDGVVVELRAHIARVPHIAYAAAYGSLARGEWSPTSDLDVRLVRMPGLWAGLVVCGFAARERSRAFVRRFPLDLFVLDSEDGLSRMNERDAPVVFLDRRERR